MPLNLKLGYATQSIVGTPWPLSRLIISHPQQPIGWWLLHISSLKGILEMANEFVLTQYSVTMSNEE